MKTVVVYIGKTENNYSAMIEGLEGFVCTANTLDELKKEVAEGIEFHKEGFIEDNEPIPEIIQGDFQLLFK